MALLFFLSRFLILIYCLWVPGCRQMFSSVRWALLQVCPNMFKDVFLEALRTGERRCNPRISPAVHCPRWVRIGERGACCPRLPQFSSESKLQLVVDEAQILSDKSLTSFQSSSTQGDLRPILSILISTLISSRKTVRPRSSLTARKLPTL